MRYGSFRGKETQGQKKCCQAAVDGEPVCDHDAGAHCGMLFCGSLAGQAFRNAVVCDSAFLYRRTGRIY